MMNLRTVFLNALMLQILLSIAALPFLLWWHMPYPLLSIVGNLVHPIFLTAFLFLASILFFAVLFGLPHATLGSLLVSVTTVWDHLLDTPLPAGWIALRWWYLLPAASVASIIIAHLFQEFRWHHAKKAGMLLFVLNASTGLWQIKASNNPAVSILRKGEYTVLFVPNPDNSIDIIDHGYIGHARDTKAVIHYDILPHLFFTYGTPNGISLRGHGKRVTVAQKLLASVSY